MSRNYIEIGKKISETGFFSEYLPPCFKLNNKVFLYSPAENCDLIAPLCITMSRYNGNDARRNIFIPEIGSYVVAQQYLNRENIIQEIIEFTESSDASFSPILGENNSIMRHEQSYDGSSTEIKEISSDYMDNIARKIVRSAGTKQILKLDISNCFASFYMHMIPSILLGMDAAEDEYNKILKNKNDPTINPMYTKYSKLDLIIRHQNLNRTNGLLAGILSSKIIAEGILTRIDIELSNQGIKFSRYVDDYEVYIYNGEDKRVIGLFGKILKRYGFSLNAEKTELVDFPYYVTENLEKLFRGQLTESFDNSEIMALFNTFLALEASGVKGSIRYLLKSIEKHPIEAISSNLYKSYLLTILSNNERSLTKACSLLIANKETLTLNLKDIAFINDLLTSHLHSEHDLEVIWLLYLLVETDNIEKESDIVQSIAKSSNELAKLILLRKDMLPEESLRYIGTNATSWILIYELYVAGIISQNLFVEKLNIDKNLNMYKHLKQADVHFAFP